ncbi:MAG: CYCXC family (seleno)protein [Acidobacteriota bacterium]
MRALILCLPLLLLAGCTTESPTTPTPAASAKKVPPTPPVPYFHETAAAAKPFPPTLDPKSFTDPIIRKAYQVAKEIPEILAQQPCYCYCDRSAGHKGLLDCFRDNHSSHCGTCMKEALLAKQLHEEKFTAAEIRTAIMRGDWKNVNLEATPSSH